MNRRLLLIAFLSTLALTILATGHQLTNAAPDLAPPPQHAPAIGPTPAPSWHVIAGGGGKDVYLTDVSLGSPTDGWAVGITGPSSYGVLMHYDGSTWSQTTAPTGTYGINAIKMISSTDGWAVGGNACAYSCGTLLLHYTNGTWQRVAVPPPGNSTGYSDIDINGNAGWAIGGWWALQFNGANWTPVYNSFNFYKAVSVIDGHDAWAVGTSRQARHYSGSNWLPVSLGLDSPPTLTVRMRSIHMLNASEGWAVGAGYASDGSLNQCLLVHYIGTWSSVPCPFNNYQLHAVQMRTASDVWAVGSDRSTGNGVALHYNGASWTTAPLPAGTPALHSLQLLGANDGWVVGVKGTILRLVNGAWIRVRGSGFPIGPINAPDEYTRPIDATDANTVWWIGGSFGQLHQWSNGTVTNYTTPITSGLYALDMVNSTLGWAGTASPQGPNYLLRYSSGTWTAWPITDTVSALSMIGPDEGWIASGYGSSPVLHYLNGVLTPESIGFYLDSISSLSMVDSQHGWAVGYYHVYSYTYTAGTWTVVTPTLYVQNANMRVIGISPDEAWVAGYSVSCDLAGCPATPQLHHFSGGAWTNILSPTDQLSDDWLAFFDISKVNATEWWAAGKLTTGRYAFLHYKDGVYTTVDAVGEDVKAVSMLPDGSGFASGVDSVLWLHSYPYNVYLPLIRR